jgi:hypothetical protein
MAGGEGANPQAGGAAAGPSLVSATSLNTYSGAALAAIAIWGLINKFFTSAPLAALAVAAVVALAVQFVAVPLEPAWPRGKKIVVWLVVYVANVAVLWSALLGSSPVIQEATGT